MPSILYHLSYEEFLNDNPEQLHKNMTTLYQRKMMKTFPCKKQDKK